MGAAIAKDWASLGAEVCVADINEEGIASVAEEIRAAVRKICDDKLRWMVMNDPNPFIRGYASIGAGMAGAKSAADPILAMVRTTKTPEARAYGALGLALLGTKQGSTDIIGFIKSPDQMRNGFVASHMVYALGLTKDLP